MGKHRHAKDKMYVTFWEQKNEWEGKKETEKVPLSQLPFYCCSLGLQPFENPVSSPDGVVYDLVNIVPFLKKYKTCPVTGNPLKIQELIKLNFSKNEKGDYHDPISFRTYSDFTHIVFIKNTGNVYSYDSIEELNKKPKYWRDLISNEPFTGKDIITIQDPKDIKRRTINNFDYIQNNKAFDVAKTNNNISNFINQTQTSKKVIEQVNKKIRESQKQVDQKEVAEQEFNVMMTKRMKDLTKKITVQEFIDYTAKNNCFRHERETTGFEAISVTSTFNKDKVNGETQYRFLTRAEVRKKLQDEIKDKQWKGLVTLHTNHGDLKLQLYCNFAPIACENFLELCETGYYTGTEFHRLVKDFILQGGDPTGKGYGGQSIFGEEFEDEFHPKLSHKKIGMVSMANIQKDSNGSQFFFTLANVEHLDGKHTVFGEIIEGLQVLKTINRLETTDKQKPAISIYIQDVIIHENPFRKILNNYREAFNKQEKLKKKIEIDEVNKDERWIEQYTEFQLPRVNSDSESDDEQQNELKQNKKNKNKNRNNQNKETEVEQEEPARKKQKNAGVFSALMQNPVGLYQKSEKRKGFNFTNW